MRYLGQTVTFLQQETTEIRNGIRVAWATFQKYRQELTSKNYMLKHRLRLFDAVIMLRVGNMDIHQRARKNETIDATQNAPTHHTNEKKIQKIVKQKVKTNEEKDTNDLSSTGDESEDGQSSNTHKDQDGDVSFENDTEEEIDATEIEEEEEEDWIDCIKKKHRRSHGKDGNCEDSMLEQDSKNEMETGDENCNITE